MANSKSRWEPPNQWNQWSLWLAAGLHARNRWRLPVLLLGILFANGRRIVTSWLRAAGVREGFQNYYYLLAVIGRKTNLIATQLGIIGSDDSATRSGHLFLVPEYHSIVRQIVLAWSLPTATSITRNLVQRVIRVDMHKFLPAG